MNGFEEVQANPLPQSNLANIGAMVDLPGVSEN